MAQDYNPAVINALNAQKRAQNLLSYGYADIVDPVDETFVPMAIIPKKTKSTPKFDVTVDPYEAETLPYEFNEKQLNENIYNNTNSFPDVTYDKKVGEDYSISKFNNPGNIEATDIKWEGLAEGGYGPNNRFAIFKTPEAGIRALRKDLTTKLNTFDGDLLKMIKKYAPASENDVDKYLKVVQQSAGVKDKYTIEDLDNIVKGFIRMENKKDLADKYIGLMNGR